MALFSTYATRENRVTAAVLAALRSLSVHRIEHIVGALLEQSDFELIRFEEQAKGSESVPDAQIVSSCRLLIETKCERNSLREQQLRGHLSILDGVSEGVAKLLTLTPDESRPKLIDEINDERVVWASFADLSNAIDGVFENETEIVSEREAFLLRELQQLLKAESLTSPPYDTVIVAARYAWPVYLRHHSYRCPADRTFQPVQRMAFYLDNRIEVLVPKILEVYENVVIEPGQHTGKLGQVVDGYIRENADTLGAHRKIFLLSGPEDPQTIKLPHHIINDYVSKSGRRAAYVQSKGYARSTDLQSAKTTTELIRLMA